ncbi:DUF2514 domain-containing protein [Aeromonas caviae]|uniref:DUF2514 domain-containing protein n=1 Tax=Aeromonas caviae TaxID=648 RepID=UPI002B49858A|nr:DUF2514 domain-containing protein [Aeromonas caviae]
MIPAELIRRALPYLLAIAIALCALWGAYRHGVDITDTAWQSKWDKQSLELAEAKAKAIERVREEEQRMQSAIDKVRQHAEQQIARAEADATDADAAADRVRHAAERLAARANQCASHTGAAQPGETARQPAVVLADLLSRADARAGELARAYDRARASGLACERAYHSLISQQ